MTSYYATEGHKRPCMVTGLDCTRDCAATAGACILEVESDKAHMDGERRALAIETFIHTVAGPAFNRDDLREEAKHIIAGTFPYTRGKERPA